MLLYHYTIPSVFTHLFVSPYPAFTYSFCILCSTFQGLSSGTGFRPWNGGGQKCTKVNRTHVDRVEIERRSLGGHAGRNLTAQCRNYTAKRWYIHYVPNWLSCLASSVAWEETEKRTGSCKWENYTMECGYVEKFSFLRNLYACISTAHFWVVKHFITQVYLGHLCKLRKPNNSHYA